MKHVIAGLIVLLLPLSAVADPAWLIMKTKSSSLEEGEKVVFQELLAGEIRGLSKEPTELSDKVCADEQCACESGREGGAKWSVFSAVSRLGQKWIVSASSVNTENCRLEQSARLSVLNVEELEEVSNQLSKVLVEGVSLEAATEVGNVTEKEQAKARLKRGNDGLSLGVGAMVPMLSLQGAAGVMVSVGYWFEGLDFAIEPNLVVGGAATSKAEGTYDMFKMGASAYYLFSRGNIAPFAGGGAGIRYISEARTRGDSVGQVIQFEPTGEDVRESWAPGLVAGGGLMFMRTYETRLSLNVDYDMSFVTLHGDGPIQTINIGLTVIF